jgi:hypothetical protein
MAICCLHLRWLQRGFFVLIVLMISACGGGSDADTSPTDEASSGDADDSSVIFDVAPLDLSKVEFILPMGGMIGNHVTPIDHQYYVASDFSSGQTIEIDVYAIADGTVTSIQHMGINNDDYRFTVQHTNAISSTYIHVDSLSDKLEVYAPTNGQYVSTQIEVSKAEVLGNYSGSVDFNLVDEDVTLTGFINPQSYIAEPWKVHVPDPFDYFTDSIRQTLLNKSLRTSEPAGGKLDHDIQGRLVGNWFVENTNGYAGLAGSDYWLGHLAFAYDYIVPTHVIASFGNYLGEQEQFGVAGNVPDPADVSVDSGLVKYELVDYDYYVDGQRWDRDSHAQGFSMQNYPSVHGVVLVQLVEPDRLKMELFDGQTAASVHDFTVNASFYER